MILQGVDVQPHLVVKLLLFLERAAPVEAQLAPFSLVDRVTNLTVIHAILDRADDPVDQIGSPGRHDWNIANEVGQLGVYQEFGEASGVDVEGLIP
eukprot:scaffold94584_cov57-Phaeocystis_antarctica.AAC.6